MMQTRDQQATAARHAWADLNAAAFRAALPRPSLVRRVARALAPVVGPLLVLLAPPLGIVWLVLFSR